MQGSLAPQELRRRYGPVALVTGASSGIGEQFARQLAQAGLDLVLVARRRERLDALAESLRASCGVRVVCASVDLAQRDFLEPLLAACEGLEVGLVVSNAGVGAKGRLHETSRERLDTVIDVNCRAPTMLAHAFAPPMIERGRGGILIVGSIEAYTPTPYSAPYAASKAFAHSLGAGLWAELLPEGIDVVVMAPGATDTEMLPNSGMRKEDIPTPVMTAAEVAREGIERLGRGPSHIAGFANRLMVGALGLLPRRVAIRAAGWGMQNAMEKGRRRSP